VVTFGDPVPAEEVERLPGVSDVEVRDAVARFTVHGTMDPVVKALARHEVVTLSAQEPDLEELFLDRYADG